MTSHEMATKFSSDFCQKKSTNGGDIVHLCALEMIKCQKARKKKVKNMVIDIRLMTKLVDTGCKPKLRKQDVILQIAKQEEVHFETN